jgi:PAS domain S-box-containing protein
LQVFNKFGILPNLQLEKRVLHIPRWQMGLKTNERKPTSFLRRWIYPIVITLVISLLLNPSICLSLDHSDLIDPNRNFALSEQEKQFIQSLPSLRVMIDDNFVPLSSYDSKTGSFEGLSVDLFRHVATQLGLKYQLLHDAKLSWSDKVELFKKQKIDLLMPASFTDERARYGIFTNSFYDTYYGAIVKKSSPTRIKNTHDLALYRIGVTKSSSIIPFIQSSIPDAQIRYYKNQSDLYQGVRNGEIDVALQNKNVFHDDRFKLSFVDLVMPFTIVENPRRYSYYLIRTEPYQRLAAIIDRYLLGADYSRLISEYERSEDELILRYNEQVHQKKLLVFGTSGSLALLVLLGGAYLNHRRFTAKLASTLEQVQHQKMKLQSSEEKYRGLFDNSRDALMILEPPDCKFSSGNQAAVDMFWLNERNDFISHGPWEFSPETQPDGSSSIEKAREMMETTLRDGYHLFEWTHCRINGDEFQAEVFLTRIEEEGGQVVLQATIRDITDRKRAEQELRESRKHYQAIVDAYDGQLYICSQDYKILFMNSKLIERTGRNAIGEPCFKALHDMDAICPWCVNERVFKGEIVKWEVQSPKDGRWYYVVNTPIYNDDGTISKQAMIQDITDRKQAETENRQLEQQFQHAQKLESLGVLAGGIAHDFNNILTVILGHCYLASELSDAELDYKAAFQKIETAGHRAADLCRQMLTYAGKSPMIQTYINLKDMVDEVVKMLQAAIKKNVVIEIDTLQSVPTIRGDISQIQQVVMNLIINAAEAIGDNNGTIKVKLTNEELGDETTSMDAFGTVITGGSFTCLEVSDSGCGMDEETQKRIFEPFYTTKSTGRGLGMSAICGIIKSHDGILYLNSTPGVGTTFKVYFPIPDVADSAETSPSVSESFDRESGTILLVEDEQVLRSMGIDLLETLGFSAINAQDGHEALKIYRERGSEIDLVLLDLIMPDMGGIEAYRELRAINPELPIIICSGYSIESVSDVIENDRNASFTSKPYIPNELRNLMLRMIN